MGKNQEESLPKAKNGQAVTKQLVQKESGASLPPQVTKQVQPEGGWGWVVCFTSLCANGTVFGCINTFGILYIAMLDQFKGDDPNISFKTGKKHNSYLDHDVSVVCIFWACVGGVREAKKEFYYLVARHDPLQNGEGGGGQ